MIVVFCKFQVNVVSDSVESVNLNEDCNGIGDDEDDGTSQLEKNEGMLVWLWTFNVCYYLDFCLLMRCIGRRLFWSYE